MKPLVVFQYFGAGRTHAGKPSDKRENLRTDTQPPVQPKKRWRKKLKLPDHFPFGVPGI